jgi:hypothetical protein
MLKAMHMTPKLGCANIGLMGFPTDCSYDVKFKKASPTRTYVAIGSIYGKILHSHGRSNYPPICKPLTPTQAHMVREKEFSHKQYKIICFESGRILFVGFFFVVTQGVSRREINVSPINQAWESAKNKSDLPRFTSTQLLTK